MPSSSISRFIPRRLLIIMLLAFFVRVVFLLFGASAFYHSNTFYFNGDSGSYILAFENLWNAKKYTFNLLEPDAAFGRLPGYPLFYGVHFLIFGSKLAPEFVAWSQLIIDVGAVWLVFRILRHLEPAQLRAAYIGAFIYAIYPFIIVWVPVIGTETLSTDLMLLWLYAIVVWQPSAYYAIGVGILVAMGLFVREYMGVLLPITLLYPFLRSRETGIGYAVRQAAFVIIGFGLLYSMWPVRNYMVSHRLILLKPHAAGYANQTADVDEFYQWVHCWTADENPWLDSVIVGKGPVHFPVSAFSTAAEQAQSQQLVDLARRCGSGFYVIRNGIPNWSSRRDTAAMLANTAYRQIRMQNCNEVIGNGFQQMRLRFARQHPLRFWLDVPLQNLGKAVFKSVLTPAQALDPSAAPRPVGILKLLLQFLFGYRTLLLFIGWGGLLVGLRKHRELWPILLFCTFQYFYICFIYRGLEMRYLLQADVLLLLPAALLLSKINKFFQPTLRE